MSGAGIPVVYHTEQDVPSIEMANTTSAGSRQDHERDGHVDYNDKSDSISRNNLSSIGKVYVMKGRSTL